MVDLSVQDKLTAADLIVIWSSRNQKYRGLPSSGLLEYLEENLNIEAGKPDYEVDYSAPTADAFNAVVPNTSASSWLILTPDAIYASGTITLPAFANAIDKQEALVTTTEEVTAITVDKNGATGIYGAPTTLSAGDSFTMRFNLATKSWYRVN